MKKERLELNQRTLSEFSNYLREGNNKRDTRSFEHLSEEELKASLYYLTAELVAAISGREIEELPDIDMDLVEKGKKVETTWVEVVHRPYLDISDEELNEQINGCIEQELDSPDIPSSWKSLWEKQE